MIVNSKTTNAHRQVLTHAPGIVLPRNNHRSRCKGISSYLLQSYAPSLSDVPSNLVGLSLAVYYFLIVASIMDLNSHKEHKYVIKEIYLSHMHPIYKGLQT